MSVCLQKYFSDHEQHHLSLIFCIKHIEAKVRYLIQRGVRKQLELLQFMHSQPATLLQWMVMHFSIACSWDIV